MKTQILMYASNGNDLVKPYKELSKLSDFEDIFTFVTYENPKYESDRNLKTIVYKFESLFIAIDKTNESVILANLQMIRNHKDNYLNNILDLKWVNSLHIETYRILGLDYQKLMDRRELNIQERKAKEEREKLERLESAKQAIEKRNQLLETSLIMLKEGKEIDKDYFIELCKLKNIPLHIRTIGLLNRMSSASIGIGSANIKCAGAKKVNLDMVFIAAKKLVEA